MAANLTVHGPMGAVQTISGNTPMTAALPELAGQTFLLGVPVQLSTTGYVQRWDGTTVANGIAGVTLQPGANLNLNGRGTPGWFSQVGPPAAIQTYGNVINQPPAYNIAVGAPMTDGRNYFERAISDTIFEGQFDNSAGTVAADYAPTLLDVGREYGIAFDAFGTAFVDKALAVSGTNTVLKIVAINPVDLVQDGTPNTYILNARVRFVFLPSAQQLYGG
jgi:hypothetical protein